MKGKIVVAEDGTLKVVNSSEILSRKVKVASLIKKAETLLKNLRHEKKELNKKVLAMVGARSKFAEGGEDVTKKDVKKQEKGVGDQIGLVEKLMDELKEIVTQILKNKDEGLSDKEEEKIKNLLEDVDDEELDTEDELSKAEDELLKIDNEDKESKKEEEEKNNKKESSKKVVADLDQIKEEAKTIVDKSNSITDDKEKVKNEIDLAENEDQVKEILEKTKATTTSSSLKKKILRKLALRRLKRRIAMKKAQNEKYTETVNTSPKFRYVNDTLRKDYFKGKDIENISAREEMKENAEWRKELKKMDRKWMYRGYGSQGGGKIASKILQRRAQLTTERAFDVAAEAQFKGLIENPLKEAMINNLVSYGIDEPTAVSIVEDSYIKAAEKTFDVLKKEASRLANLDSKEFIKEARFVRETGVELPIESKSVPIIASKEENDPYKEYWKTKESRPLGSIL